MTFSEQRARGLVSVRSGGRCEVCGREGASVHHRVKRSAGGTWHPANLLRTCGDGTRFCHGWIEGRPTHAQALGLWVPSYLDPVDVPMYVRPEQFARGWWRTDEHGLWHYVDHDVPTPAEAAAIAALTAARLTAGAGDRWGLHRG